MSIETDISNSVLDLVTTHLKRHGRPVEEPYYFFDSVLDSSNGVVRLKQGFKSNTTAIVLNRGDFRAGDGVLVIRTLGDELWVYAPPRVGFTFTAPEVVEEVPNIDYYQWPITRSIVVGFIVGVLGPGVMWPLTVMMWADWERGFVLFRNYPWWVNGATYLIPHIMPLIKVTMKLYVNEKLRNEVTLTGPAESEIPTTNPVPPPIELYTSDVVADLTASPNDKIGFSFDFSESQATPPEYSYYSFYLFGLAWCPIMFSRKLFRATMLYPTSSGGNMFFFGNSSSPFYLGLSLYE